MFSIVTITRNNLDGLRKTAESLQAQTCTEYEWIVIDGASEDGTLAFLQQFRVAGEFSYTSEPDRGIYDAMNKGIDRAQHAYTLFMNAGDTFAAPDTLQRLATDISAQTFPDLIYGPAWEERPGHEPGQKSPLKLKFLWWGLPAHHQAILYKTNIIKQLRYNISYKIAADYDLTCRFTKRTKTVHITFFPICLFEAGGLSQRAVTQGRREQFLIRRTLKLVSPPVNYLIYVLQSIVMALRQNAPQIYWLLRGFSKKMK
ncbi:MAG: glycosyltransferase [Rhodospirillales bacterium]|nr:glycosyltransferase [Rhodospirillales bacterium]MCB9965697.1 glycosyltransferase [Rhodospirillales bacterium]MCB9980100.1 glycosyltransferase [Rhodospirillales bacterium]